MSFLCQLGNNPQKILPEPFSIDCVIHLYTLALLSTWLYVKNEIYNFSPWKSDMYSEASFFSGMVLLTKLGLLHSEN